MKTAIDLAVPFGIGTDIFFGDCDTPLPKPPDDYDDESTPLAGTDREAMAAVLGFDPDEEGEDEAEVDDEENDDDDE